MFLRGHPHEEAVLCTQSKTYAIKFVGTSNSACLVPPSNQLLMSENLEDCSKVASVIKMAPGNMELVEVAPRLERLKSLLSENPYRLEDVSDMEMEGVTMDKTGLFTWDDLVNEVQASDDEIKSGLEALSAVEIDGYWRIIDDSYIDMFLRMLFPNMVLNDWSPDELDEDKVLSALESDGFPHKIAHHCLSVYSDLVSEVDGKSVRKLNAKHVCVHFARNILKQGKMKRDRFTEQWMRQIPEGIQASLDMLEGEILAEKIGVETWIQGFSVHSLPSTPSERFSALFKERPRWDWKDLQPYIRYCLIFNLQLVSESEVMFFTNANLISTGISKFQGYLRMVCFSNTPEEFNQVPMLSQSSLRVNLLRQLDMSCLCDFRTTDNKVKVRYVVCCSHISLTVLNRSYVMI